MKTRGILACSFFLAAASAFGQFAHAPGDPEAAEQFKTGVEAYYRGRFAESVLLFERALSRGASDPLALYWLGKSYRKLGYESAATDSWTMVKELVGDSVFLDVQRELLSAEPGNADDPVRLVRMGEIPGKKGRETFFSRPSWIEPDGDGSYWVVAHGSNEIIRIDANGVIVEKLRTLSALDRPFACARSADGSMVVTEFQADRVARFGPGGKFIGYSGDASGPGRLKGPQYVAFDADGSFYVSEAGFARIVKFDPSGAFVQAFGEKTPAYSGLRLPTGVAVIGDRIFVADLARKSLSVFDLFGNYLGEEADGLLGAPEGLRASGVGALLICDGGKLLRYRLADGRLDTLLVAESKGSRFLSASPDGNGNMVLADFDSDRIVLASDPATQFAGYRVEIERVYADAFPMVKADIVVKDREGHPVLGLSGNNFYASERIVKTEQRIDNGRAVNYRTETIVPAAEFAFEGRLDDSPRVEICFLAERSPETEPLSREMRDAIAEIYGALPSSGGKRIVAAGAVPVLSPGGNLRELTLAALGAAVSPRWRFDSGLRLAATSLFGTTGRRAIVLLSSGGINEDAIQSNALYELGTLLSNNDIQLHVVSVTRNAPSKALMYLVERTGGSVQALRRPEGLAVWAAGLQNLPTGRYRIGFLSKGEADFGRAYLPFSVEVYLWKRSGRDETGFFAPIE